jgi:cobalt/nickel transport system ATP-binding protein
MTALALHAKAIGYPSSDPILRDVALDVQPGECVAILGANGAGKSALLRAAAGLMPRRGLTVTIFGHPVASATDAVRAGLGLVLQNPDDQLFGPTLLDDVAFGPENLGLSAQAARARAREALQTMHIAPLEDRSIDALSFGERKRAAIAAVLAMNPRLLLLDEPTAGLDPLAEVELSAHLRGLQSRGTTILVATHAVDLVPLFADRVLVVAGGGIAADGACRAVLTDAPALAEARLRPPQVAELFVRTRPGRAVAETPLTMQEAIAWMPSAF